MNPPLTHEELKYLERYKAPHFVQVYRAEQVPVHMRTAWKAAQDSINEIERMIRNLPVHEPTK